MPDSSLSVKISADVTSLQAQSAVAKAELSSLNASVRSLATQFVGASDEMKSSLAPQLDAAAQKAAVARTELAALNAEMKGVVHPEVMGFFGQLNEGMVGTTEKIEALTSKFTTFSKLAGAVSEFVMAGLAIEKVGEAIESTAETGEQIGQLSEKTGIATTTLSGLRVAAVETNVGMDTLSTGLRNLGRNVQAAIINPNSTAAKSFQAMNVAITDSTGAMLPLDDILGELSTKYASYEDGTAKAALASDQFGAKLGSSLLPLLDKIGTESIPELTQRAAEMGVSFDEAATIADEKFAESMKDSGLTVEGLKDTVSNALIPALTVLETAFTSNAGGMSLTQAAAETLGGGLKVVVEAATMAGESFAIVFDQALLVGQEFGSLINMSRALGLAMEGDFKEAATVVENSGAQMAQSYNDDIAKMQASEKTFLDVHNALWNNAQTAPTAAAAPQQQQQQAPQLQASSGGADWMKENDSQLEQQNLKIEQSATSTKEANAEKLANTVQYWQGVLSAGNLTAAQEFSAQDALNKAEMASKANSLSTGTSAAKSAATTETQIATDAANARKAVAASEYETQISVWDSEVTQKKMTKSQELQDEISAQNQMYQAALAEANQEAALDAAGTAAKAKALDDIEVLTASHNAEIAKLNNDLVTQQITDAKAVQDAQTKASEATSAAWQKAFQPISQAFDQSLNGVLQGTQTMQQASGKAAQSIALAYIDAEAKKLVNFVASEAMILAKGVATQAGLTAATQAGIAVQTATKTAADATGKTEDVALGTAQINSSAMRAAAGAYSAVAGIPIVGPVLAPAAAATAYAGVMAFDILSAEGGMAIPAGVNPMTQLHENEMVLPAHIAQPLQNMIAGGSTSSSVSNTHFNIHQTLNGGAGNGNMAAQMATMGKGIVDSIVDLGRNGTLRLPGR